jgi:hypothetical protein
MRVVETIFRYLSGVGMPPALREPLSHNLSMRCKPRIGEGLKGAPDYLIAAHSCTISGICCMACRKTLRHSWS